MRKLPLDVLPAASLAVHVTRVIPTAKRLPEPGEHATTGEGSTLSVALTPNVTTPPSRLVAFATISPGSDNTGAVTSSKRAVTVVLAVSVTLQVPVPEQPPPLQPAKVEPVAGVTLRVTTVPLLNEAEQVAPQLIPAGSEVTVPRPVPVLVTERVNLCRADVAVTVVSAFKVTVQVVLVPEHPPLHPVKVDPVVGVAASVTNVPLSREAEQVAPQSIPEGSDVTVPLPVPPVLTVRVTVRRVKVAVTVVAAFMVTVQAPVPAQPPPLHPVKAEPVAGVAVSVTTVPLSKGAEQVLPQLIPAGFEVTVPLPEPSRVTERVNCVPPEVTPKRANTVVFAVRVRVQVPVPVQPPPVQPSKMEPVAGVAVRVTGVPLSKDAEQVVPQLIPGGLEVTAPMPVPSRITERVKRVAVPLTTVSVVLPLRPPEVAVIVVDPGLRPVATPFASMVATAVSLLVHVTLPPIPPTATAAGSNAQAGLFGQV